MEVATLQKAFREKKVELQLVIFDLISACRAMRIHEENLWLGGMNHETPGDVRAKVLERMPFNSSSLISNTIWRESCIRNYFASCKKAQFLQHEIGTTRTPANLAP